MIYRQVSGLKKLRFQSMEIKLRFQISPAQCGRVLTLSLTTYNNITWQVVWITF